MVPRSIFLGRTSNFGTVATTVREVVSGIALAALRTMPQPTKNSPLDQESLDPKSPNTPAPGQPDADEEVDEEARIPQGNTNDKDDNEDSELDDDDDDDVEEIDLDDLDAMEGPDA